MKMNLSASDNALLAAVVQSKQASDGLKRSPLEGATDPLDDVQSLLSRLSPDARTMGEIIVGGLDEHDVPTGLLDAAKEFESRMSGA